MNGLFAFFGIALHLGALVWSLWLLRSYAQQWLIFLPVAILLSTVYAVLAMVHDGTPAWWQTAEFALSFYGGCLLVGGIGLHLGLVRHKQKVDALDELVSVFQEFSESAPIGFFLYQDGHYVFGTEMAVKMTGYTREELVQMNYWDLAAPATREMARTRGEARLQGQTMPNELQVPMVHKSGEIRWMHINVGTVMYRGKPAGLGAAFDITDRMQMEEALRARTLELETISDHVPYPIIRFDEHHRLLSANRAALEVAGMDPATCVGKHVEEVCNAPDLANTWRKHINEVFARARPVEMEYDQRSGGGTASYRALLVPEMEDTRTVLSVMIICRDVTERKRMQREVLEISAREQRRIGQDLHDGLGQLLTGIGFMVAGLQQTVRDGQTVDDQALREIRQLVEHAIGQTRQLAEGLDPVTVAMRGIHDGLQRLALQTEGIYGIPCSLAVDAALPPLRADVATQVYRIAQEAVNNAVKHAKPSAIQIRLDREHGRLALRVTDNGVGFTPVGQDHRGLGLRIMDYRATMIAGEFTIMPNPAGGSIVTCRFDPT